MNESAGRAPTTAATAVSSPDVRARVAHDGYATVPFLRPDELDAVGAAHRRLARPEDAGLTIDYMRADRSPMAAIRDEVLPLLRRALAATFDEHRVIMATFVTKYPGPESDMFLHEDRAFVDEARHRAVTAWIPLSATGSSTDNGALQVVPASHRLPIGPSGSNTADAIRPFEPQLRDLLVTLDVPAGDAVVYDTRLVHASPPNRTGRPRTALVCVVLPADAQPIHVVASGSGDLRVHAVDEDFYVARHPREVEQAMPSRYPVVATVPAPPALTAADVAALGRAAHTAAAR